MIRTLIRSRWSTCWARVWHWQSSSRIASRIHLQRSSGRFLSGLNQLLFYHNFLCSKELAKPKRSPLTTCSLWVFTEPFTSLIGYGDTLRIQNTAWSPLQCSLGSCKRSFIPTSSTYTTSKSCKARSSTFRSEIKCYAVYLKESEESHSYCCASRLWVAVMGRVALYGHLASPKLKFFSIERTECAYLVSQGERTSTRAT